MKLVHDELQEDSEVSITGILVDIGLQPFLHPRSCEPSGTLASRLVGSFSRGCTDSSFLKVLHVHVHVCEHASSFLVPEVPVVMEEPEILSS